MPIGEIYKESEKLYETEEKIKLQTQNSATSLAELFIEQIDNEMLRDKKREKQRGIALKDAGTEEAYEENLELYEQLTGSLIMQNPDRAETISQNAAYLQRFVIFYSFMSLSLPRVRKRANVCRRIINIKETQKHEKPLIIQGFFYVFHIVKQRCANFTEKQTSKIPFKTQIITLFLSL